VALAACLVVLAAVCTGGRRVFLPSSLLSVGAARSRAQADQSLFSVVYGQAKRDKQALEVQKRLAAKDIRLSQSLERAADAQDSVETRLEPDLGADVRRKTVLEGSVQKLSSLLHAEEKDLKVATARLDDDSRDAIVLRRAMPRLHRAEADLEGKLARIARRQKRARKRMKTQKAEERKTKRVLRQAQRAYKNYGIQDQEDEQKVHYAMSKAALMKSKALVAERKARLEQTSAQVATSKLAVAKVHQLETAATNDKAHAALLQAEAAESIKDAQLWRAKGKEARSYQQMMQADVHAAQQRVSREESVQRNLARSRLTARHLRHELREAEREQSKGDGAMARLLHQQVQNKGTVTMGIKDVRMTRHGLNQAVADLQQVERAEADKGVSVERARRAAHVDESQARALQFAAAEHRTAADRLSEAEHAAAAEAKGLMERAKDLLAFAQMEGKSVAAEQELARVGADQTLASLNNNKAPASGVRV
jgi:hypothetical protein